MPVPATKNGTCPRCSRPIVVGMQVEQIGVKPGGMPELGHAGCKPASAAERLILTGAVAPAGPAGPDGWDAPVAVVNHRAGTTAATRYTGDGDGMPGHTDRRGGTAANHTPTPTAAADVFADFDEPPVTAETALSPEQLAELKEHTAQRAQAFAAEVVARKIETLATDKARELAPAMMANAEQKMANAGARAIARAVTEQTARLAANLEPAFAETAARIKLKVTEADDAFRAALERMDTVRRTTLVIEGPGFATEFPEGELFHAAFPEVLKLAAARFNVFMVGPTGSGKSHIGEQVARGLGVPFGLINGTAGTTEVELFGRSYPNVTTGENVYHPSEFVTVYEGGGVFVADEIDAMDPNLLLKLNGAIAQGYCTVPHRPANPRARRHKDFVFIATANTWGTGANRSYCGRNQLDEATLDRLRCGTVEVDYDPALERAFACPDPELYAVLAGWRERIMRNKFHRILSTRFMAGAYRLRQLGYDDAGIGAKLCGGWPDRERRAVLGT